MVHIFNRTSSQEYVLGQLPLSVYATQCKDNLLVAFNFYESGKRSTKNGCSRQGMWQYVSYFMTLCFIYSYTNVPKKKYSYIKKSKT